MAKKKHNDSLDYYNEQKIDPKFRMYGNCDQQINEQRALQNGNLSVKAATKTPAQEMPFQNALERPPLTKTTRKSKFKHPSVDIFTNVFININAASKERFTGEMLRNANIVAAKVPLTEIKKIARRPDVSGIEIPRTLKLSDPIITNRYAHPKNKNPLDAIRKKYPPKGEVLIGIIDVGGFDFAHPDFLDSKKETRFLKIWDQGSSFRDPPKCFKAGTYGAEFDKKHLDRAIREAASLGVPATLIEKQSSMSVGSHGTHVASIAAGNSGVFPQAKIIGVTIALKDGDFDRRKSFYDSSCLVHAMHYLLAEADHLGIPISINISLGTNGHAHDGSDATSRWINSQLSTPGRSVCIAAGNAGQEKTLSENDYGFTMGRIHTSGKIEASGLSKDIFWTVVGNGISDMSENELEIWYQPQDRISISIKPPGLPWIGPVKPNEFIENQQLRDGSFISIYNDLYHFSNGSNYIGIYLTPNYKSPKIPVKAGIWQVRLTGDEIRMGAYDGWIERDDPRPLGAFGNQQHWNFPSFFAEQSNVDNTSISSLACAHNVIAVGNCDFEKEQMNISSSQGPTRDKRNKPEVVAPGTGIVAAKGFSSPGDDWISMTGTSMASPYVCGIAAWMLSQDKNLTASQIQGIMIRTSRPLPGSDYNWKDDCGFGMIDPEKCLKESGSAKIKKDITDDY